MENSSKFKDIGDKLIEEIRKRKGKFAPLYVLTPNEQISDWFKSYWLSKEKAPLMNVNFIARRDVATELFMLKEPLLDAKTLKDIILSELLGPMGEDALVKGYLHDKTGNINPVKLDDLSSELANLYMDYEENQTDFSKSTNVYKDFEKSLKDEIKKHGSFLSDKLGDCSKDVVFFGFLSYTPLMMKIMEKCPNKTDLMLEPSGQNPKPAKLLGVPSKLREIEYLHTSICKEILNGATPRDILVVAKNLSEYETSIKQTFNQDGSGFVSVPYAIVDRKAKDSDLTFALKTFFMMCQKGFATRKDVCSLLDNGSVRYARGIDQDLASSFKNDLIEMNVYRNSEAISLNDWEYARKRVLLSSLIGTDDETMYESNGENYHPYEGRFEGEEGKGRFLSLLEDLASFLKAAKNHKTIATEEDLKDIQGELDKWFSKKDSSGTEKNGYYQRTLDTFENWRKYILGHGKSVPLENLFFDIIATSKTAKVNVDEAFLEGVSFLELEEGVAYPSAHLHLLNMSSEVFPGDHTQSELDVRDEETERSGCLKRMEDTYFALASNAGKFDVSYIDADLKDDKKFSPAKVLQGCVEPKQGTLDEKRDWNELFVEREFVNKKISLSLDKGIKGGSAKPKAAASAKWGVVTVSNMAKFLEEPLSFKAKRLFNELDDSSEDRNVNYEPLSLRGLDKWAILKDLLVETHKPGGKSKDEIIKSYVADRVIPFMNKYTQVDGATRIEKNLEKALDEVEELLKYEPSEINGTWSKPVLKKLDSLALASDIVIESGGEIFVKSLNGGAARIYFETKSVLDEPKLKGFMSLYVASLVDVASEDGDKRFDVYLARSLETPKKNGNKGKLIGIKKYAMNPKDAKEKLLEIYEGMADYSDLRFYPVTLIEEALNKGFSSCCNCALLHEKAFKPNGVWDYFDDKHLFDDKDLNYSIGDFKKEFAEETEKVYGYVKPLFMEAEYGAERKSLQDALGAAKQGSDADE